MGKLNVSIIYCLGPLEVLALAKECGELLHEFQHFIQLVYSFLRRQLMHHRHSSYLLDELGVYMVDGRMDLVQLLEGAVKS